MSQVYCILNQRKFLSRWGGDCYKIHLVGVDDQKIYLTYIQPSNDNFEHWRHIINNPDHAFLIEGLRIKRNTEDIIHADSKPTIVHETSEPDQLADFLAQIWQIKH